MARDPNFPIVNTRETAKTRWRAVPWTGGKGLDLGCGPEKLFDTEYVLGIDSGVGAALGGPVNPNIQADCKELTMFASGSFDYVFSSFLLQEFTHKEATEALRNWLRVVKTRGTVVLYLPDENQYPKCPESERGIAGEPGAHPHQKWNVNYDRLVEALAKTSWNWDLEHFEVCDQLNEYALFAVIRKLK